MIERLAGRWRKMSIKFKLMAYFLVVIVLMSFFNLHLGWNNAKVTGQFNASMSSYHEIATLQQQLRDQKSSLDAFLGSGDTEPLQDYTRMKREIEEGIDSLYSRFGSKEAYFSLKAMDNAYAHYTGLWDEAVRYRQTGTAAYYFPYYEGEAAYNYMRGYAQDLLNTSLAEGAALYRALELRAAAVGRLSIILTVSAFLFASVLFFYFANGLANPIKKLARASARMASGDLDVEPIAIGSEDEIRQLADAFNEMSVSIRSYVESLKQKADIEKKLHEEELAILKMEQLLNEAEFLALQSQINPHFLFNTLNTIGRTAMFEDAEDTMKLINALAGIFRYRIRNGGNTVTLGEELKILEDYVYLQQVRFKERLLWELQVEEDCKGMEMPIFLIQPLVENAMIHGIEPKLEGGRIRVKVRRSRGQILIRVTDTGAGMSADRLADILAPRETADGKSIGVGNVHHRLELFYGQDGSFRIFSRPGAGTSVRIAVAAQEGGHGHA